MQRTDIKYAEYLNFERKNSFTYCINKFIYYN